MTSRRVESAYSTVVWSADGSQLTKSRPSGAYARYRFRNELRVNRLLTAHRPPVATAALVRHEVRSRSLTFEALPGAPLGPKYPQDLTPDDIDAMLQLSRDLKRYNPRRRWLRRINPALRFTAARERGALDARAATALVARVRSRPQRMHFAHGDLTARNVLRHGDSVALIDWEWAGLYPPGYDEAFLWFSVREVAGGRAQVERAIASDVEETSFLLCALLIQLLHLDKYVTPEFRCAHEATRDELIGRLCEADLSH